MFKFVNKWYKRAKNELAPVPELQSDDPGVLESSGPDVEQPSQALQALVSRKAFAELSVVYAQYLMETGKADSKKTCVELVAKFISAGMDRGEATANEMDYVTHFIESDDLKIQSLWELRWSFVRDIVEGTLSDLQWNENSGLTDTEASLLNAFKEASKIYYELREKLRSTVLSTIEEMINVLLTEYAGVLDPDFVARYIKK